MARRAKPKTDPRDNPGNDVVLRKEPCPVCHSKDNLVRYADGHAHCFTPSCDHWEPAFRDGEGEPSGVDGGRAPWEDGDTDGAGRPSEFLKPDDRGWQPSAKKRLTEETIRKFGHFSTGHQGQRVGVYPYYTDEGLSFQKVKTPDKQFFVVKGENAPSISLTRAWPYGRHIWGDKHDRKVVIFTGEDDAEAAAEITKFKFPCVSVPTGDQGAKKHIQANYKWFDRFEEVILFFDNDESGQSIIQECAELFDGGKVKIARMQDFKDAAEAKNAGRPGDVEAAIYAATVWGPQGVVNARDGLNEFLEQGLIVPSWPYPWDDLETATLGMRRGEITLHLGGTGIAKTTLLYHYAQHLLRWQGDLPSCRDKEGWLPETSPVKVGWLGFEDTVRTVKVGILSIHAGRRIHINPLTPEETAKLYKEVFGAGQLEIMDPENAEWGVKPALATVKFMVKALGCQIIFMDPLSFLISMMKSGDRTQAEESLAGEMAFMVKKLNCHIHISHHLKKAEGTPFEEGGEVSLQDAKGAGAWYQYASNVFGYERNQQGSRPDLLRQRLLKVRWTGKTGVLPSLLKYDPDTGRYSPTKDKWPTEKEDKGQSFGAAEVPGGQGEY
jgi:twinkle protein